MCVYDKRNGYLLKYVSLEEGIALLVGAKKSRTRRCGHKRDMTVLGAPCHPASS